MPDTRTRRHQEPQPKPYKAIGLAVILAFDVLTTYLETGSLDTVVIREMGEAVAAIVVVYLMRN